MEHLLCQVLGYAIYVTSLISSLQQPYEIGAVIMSVLQMRRSHCVKG